MNNKNRKIFCYKVEKKKKISISQEKFRDVHEQNDDRKETPS